MVEYLLNSLGSYFTPNDGYRHAIVSTSDGEVHEIFYSPRTGKGNAKLAYLCGLRHLSAFYTPDDGLQHPIVATDTGDIFEIYYKPDDFHVTGSLANFSGMIGLSGFYAADDKTRILIVGQQNGQIHEVFYNAGIGVHVTQPALATFPGLTHVAGFYTGDDNYRHVIAATDDGNITEVYYHPTIGVHVSEPPIANFQNIVSLAAFYSDDDRMRIVIVATNDGAIHEIFYRPDFGVHVTQPALTTFPNIRAIGAFYTSDDKYRHVIVADTDGTVTEIYYHPTIGVHVSEPPLATLPLPTTAIEMVGPDLENIDTGTRQNLGGTSPAGRCVAIAGSQVELYTIGHTGGLWKSTNLITWNFVQGAPAPADIFGASFTLAVSTNAVSHAAVGSADGVWETLTSGVTWSHALDPSTLGAGGSSVTAVAFDDADRLFVGIEDGLAIRAAGSTFQHVGLGTQITAIAIGDNKVWARSVSALFVSADHGSTWSPPIPIPGNISIRPKERFALAATDDFAYMMATRSPGETGCGGDNLLVVFDAGTNAWRTQTVLSSDLAAWQQANTGKPGDPHTCDGTGGDDSADGRRFIKSIRLRDTTAPNVIGQRIQLLYGSGQEVWRARAAGGDGMITDWNWVVGTQGAGFSNRDPVHADIWDAHVNPALGGLTYWVAGDGGVYRATVALPGYDVPIDRSWQPNMAGLHTHQIQMLTLLRTSAVARPRLIYAIGDSGAYWRNTSPIALPEAPWGSTGFPGDGSFTMGDSSTPLFAQLVRQLTLEGLFKFPSSLTPNRLINPKTTSFVDPAVPTRFRFVPSPWQDGQFSSADVVMMVDLPLTFQQNTIDVPFPNQPGPASDGSPVLIRNRNFDANPDINGANAQGKGWTLERGSLPSGTQGFAISGDRMQPVYYVSDGSILYTERSSGWTPALRNLVSSQTFGPVFANPYDARVVYVLTSDQGVVVSSDAGSTFTPDATLNALVGSETAKVNQIAFNYDRPSTAVACTEIGRVFHSPSPGVWRDLSGLLPTPLISTRSIAVDCEAIYLGTFGRGLMRIVHYGAA